MRAKLEKADSLGLFTIGVSDPVMLSNSLTAVMGTTSGISIAGPHQQRRWPGHHLGTAGVTQDNRSQRIGQGPGHMPNSEGLQRRENAQRTNNARRDIWTRYDTLLRHVHRNNQAPGAGRVEKGRLQPHAQPYAHGPQGNGKTCCETVHLARNVQTTDKVGTRVPRVPTIQDSTAHRTRSAGL